MPYKEIIESLPIPEDYKSGLIDLCLWFSVAVFNVYDKNVFTVLVTITGFVILLFRCVKVVLDTKKSYHEQEISKIEHENMKDSKEKEPVMYRIVKDK